MSLLLNADVGEGLDSDSQLYPFLDQASIACGGHCGNVQSMQQAVQACKEHGICIGAHPAYPDIKNFGRVSLQIELSKLKQSLRQQIGTLNEICQSQDVALRFIKPHGALYNDMMHSAEMFELIVTEVAAYPLDLALMIAALPVDGSYQLTAEELGVPLWREAFADRLYLDSGQLCSRGKSGAVFSDPQTIVAQASSIMHSKSVTTATNCSLAIAADSLCLHGDNPASVAAVREVSGE